MDPEEEPQELARQQQALPKSCFSVTLCTPVLPVWPLLTQTSCLGSCPCTPLWGQAGEAGNGWRNSSRACVCLCVGGKGQAGKAKPGRSHRAQGQAGASWSSALLPHRSNVAGATLEVSQQLCHPHFHRPALPMPKFPMQVASRANTPSTATRQGRPLLPPPAPGQPQACQQT